MSKKEELLRQFLDCSTRLSGHLNNLRSIPSQNFSTLDQKRMATLQNGIDALKILAQKLNTFSEGDSADVAVEKVAVEKAIETAEELEGDQTDKSQAGDGNVDEMVRKIFEAEDLTGQNDFKPIPVGVEGAKGLNDWTPEVNSIEDMNQAFANYVANDYFRRATGQEDFALHIGSKTVSTNPSDYIKVADKKIDKFEKDNKALTNGLEIASKGAVIGAALDIAISSLKRNLSYDEYVTNCKLQGIEPISKSKYTIGSIEDLKKSLLRGGFIGAASNITIQGGKGVMDLAKNNLENANALTPEDFSDASDLAAEKSMEIMKQSFSLSRGYYPGDHNATFLDWLQANAEEYFSLRVDIYNQILNEAVNFAAVGDAVKGGIIGGVLGGLSGTALEAIKQNKNYDVYKAEAESRGEKPLSRVAYLAKSKEVHKSALKGAGVGAGVGAIGNVASKGKLAEVLTLGKLKRVGSDAGSAPGSAPDVPKGGIAMDTAPGVPPVPKGLNVDKMNNRVGGAYISGRNRLVAGINELDRLKNTMDNNEYQNQRAELINTIKELDTGASTGKLFKGVNTKNDVKNLLLSKDVSMRKIDKLLSNYREDSAHNKTMRRELSSIVAQRQGLNKLQEQVDQLSKGKGKGKRQITLGGMANHMNQVLEAMGQTQRYTSNDKMDLQDIVKMSQNWNKNINTNINNAFREGGALHELITNFFSLYGYYPEHSYDVLFQNFCYDLVRQGELNFSDLAYINFNLPQSLKNATANIDKTALISGGVSAVVGGIGGKLLANKKIKEEERRLGRPLTAEERSRITRKYIGVGAIGGGVLGAGSVIGVKHLAGQGNATAQNILNKGIAAKEKATSIYDSAHKKYENVKRDATRFYKRHIHGLSYEDQDTVEEINKARSGITRQALVKLKENNGDASALNDREYKALTEHSSGIINSGLAKKAMIVGGGMMAYKTLAPLIKEAMSRGAQVDQAQINALIQKMQAEGRSEAEIRAAVQQLLQNAFFSYASQFHKYF